MREALVNVLVAFSRSPFDGVPRLGYGVGVQRDHSSLHHVVSVGRAQIILSEVGNGLTREGGDVAHVLVSGACQMSARRIVGYPLAQPLVAVLADILANRDAFPTLWTLLDLSSALDVRDVPESGSARWRHNRCTRR